jgi:hypothetical protein
MPQDIPSGPLGPARNVPGYADIPLSALTHKRFACPQDPKLYPTHPSQYAKEYHIFKQATYDRTQIDGRDDACMLSQVKDDRPGMVDRVSNAVRNRIIAQADASGRKIFCQLGHVIHQVVLSDTYIDACGNYYRGIKRFAYKKSDDNMGTLFSPGRTSYNKGATMADGQYDGDTYAVDHREFYFLAELLPGDMSKINEQRAVARSTHTLDASRRLFKYKG